MKKQTNKQTNKKFVFEIQKPELKGYLTELVALAFRVNICQVAQFSAQRNLFFPANKMLQYFFLYARKNASCKQEI